MLRLLTFIAALVFAVTPLRAETISILAFGDSLTAGFGLAPEEAFPARLEAALKGRGHDVKIVNGGVSGDIAADGLARLDWSLTGDIDAVIVELGANDALRGLAPQQAEASLDQIMTILSQKNLPVLIAGMMAPPNLGHDYGQSFNGMYQRLAEKHGALLYPFFLDGVAADPSLNQADGLHPNAKGVEAIVQRITPAVEELLGNVGKN